MGESGTTWPPPEENSLTCWRACFLSLLTIIKYVPLWYWGYVSAVDVTTSFVLIIASEDTIASSMDVIISSVKCDHVLRGCDHVLRGCDHFFRRCDCFFPCGIRESGRCSNYHKFFMILPSFLVTQINWLKSDGNGKLNTASFTFPIMVMCSTRIEDMERKHHEWRNTMEDWGLKVWKAME